MALFRPDGPLRKLECTDARLDLAGKVIGLAHFVGHARRLKLITKEAEAAFNEYVDEIMWVVNAVWGHEELQELWRAFGSVPEISVTEFVEGS